MTNETTNKFAAILAAAQAKAQSKSAPIAAKKEVKILGQTVNEGTKLHSKLVQQVKQFNDLASSEATIPAPLPEMSTMTFADLIPDTLPEPESQVKFTIVDYSDKSFAIIGDTYPLRNQLRKLGGTFNYNLTCGKGWIFAKKHLQDVKDHFQI